MTKESANTPSMETIVSLTKRRGFVFQASEIYGGIAGFWDYGPYGVELANNLKAAWWKAFVEEPINTFGIDSAIIQSPKLWEASGHVAGFVDPMIDCKACKHRFRADHIADLDTGDLQELAAALKDKACPNCGKHGTFTEPRQFNMMLTTHIGPVEEDTTKAYLRPETAGGIFVNYDNVRETTRSKIPFGIGQIGKAFRNEITPKDFIFRVRELEQMEMQYFVDPKTRDKEYENWRTFTRDFLLNYVGLSEDNIKWHEHQEGERAHYAAAAHDIYYRFPHGFKELLGVHNRTDFDLKAHIEHSKKDLSYFDEETRERFIPNVIESSMGVGRLFVAALTEAYTEEKVNDETRVVLKFKPAIAPIKIAVLPLSKKPELTSVAREIYASLAGTFRTEYDETQSIGRRYRRQDEIGTPLCVTIDFESLEDKAVTVRHRDTMEQTRVKIAGLPAALKQQLSEF
ncbi:MAG: glycyl-tRNA synthetase [Patescibacteria group bacterium]|nr:glycyl-tRNA synthetase [Patescibacteria group bacterium]